MLSDGQGQLKTDPCTPSGQVWNALRRIVNQFITWLLKIRFLEKLTKGGFNSV